MSAGSTLSEKEKHKKEVISNAIDGKITNGTAGKMLGLSVRQIKRLKQQFRLRGDAAIMHGLKERKSNHAFSEGVKTEALKLIKKNYSDFKPKLAAEKLQELHQIEITSQTVREWMTEEGLWKKRRQKPTGEYHAWRPRKEHYGEMEQFDGSYHYWLEDRFVDAAGEPIELCLLAAIDDATGEITKAVFAANEGVVAVFTFWQEYILEKGKPGKIYADKLSTYKINHKSAVDNSELKTQFQRACQTLSIELIPAHSPQAKGRIERLFQTLQDRLIKELRLARITTPEAANTFLSVFIPKFNKQFGVRAAKEGDVHRALSKEERQELTRTFSVQCQRKVNEDFTIQFKNQWYQLAEVQSTSVRARETVLVEEWLDGTIYISLRGYYLTYTLLPERPRKTKKQPTILTTHKLNWKPPKDHPWRKPLKQKS